MTQTKDSIFDEEVLDELVLKLLKINGFSPSKSPIEYDKTIDDSQYSLTRDAILEIVSVADAYKILCLDCDKYDLLIPMHSCTLELDASTEEKP